MFDHGWLANTCACMTCCRMTWKRQLVLLEVAGTAGNLTTDAQIAAVALRLDGEVHTADFDFGRFAGVRFSNPLL